jgi:hypothetical protein
MSGEICRTPETNEANADQSCNYWDHRLQRSRLVIDILSNAGVMRVLIMPADGGRGAKYFRDPASGLGTFVAHLKFFHVMKII